MFLGCTVVSTVTRARSLVRSAPLACATRRLSASNRSSLSPKRLRQWLRSERSCGKVCWKVLEVRVVDPALAHALVRQPEHVLEQQQADREAALDAWTTLVAVERRHLAVDPGPVDLAGELHQLVLHVDDLVEPGPEQIAFSRRLVLLRPHRVLRCGNRITLRNPRESQNEIARFWRFGPPNLAI